VWQVIENKVMVISRKPDLYGYSNGKAFCTGERNKKSYSNLCLVRGNRACRQGPYWQSPADRPLVFSSQRHL